MVGKGGRNGNPEESQPKRNLLEQSCWEYPSISLEYLKKEGRGGVEAEEPTPIRAWSISPLKSAEMNWNNAFIGVWIELKGTAIWEAHLQRVIKRKDNKHGLMLVSVC